MPIWSDWRRPLTGNERLAWIALARTRGVGPERLAVLLEACQTAIGALSAPIAFLESLPGMPGPVARAIAAASLDDAAGEVTAVEAEGGVLLLPGDADFPDLVMPLEDQPLCLYAAGDRSLLHRPAVAIVGSRDHSGYGRDAGVFPCHSTSSKIRTVWFNWWITSQTGEIQFDEIVVRDGEVTDLPIGFMTPVNP